MIHVSWKLYVWERLIANRYSEWGRTDNNVRWQIIFRYEDVIELFDQTSHYIGLLVWSWSESFDRCAYRCIYLILIWIVWQICFDLCWCICLMMMWVVDIFYFNCKCVMIWIVDRIILFQLSNYLFGDYLYHLTKPFICLIMIWIVRQIYSFDHDLTVLCHRLAAVEICSFVIDRGFSCTTAV